MKGFRRKVEIEQSTVSCGVKRHVSASLSLSISHVKQVD